jgi:hypothetical protein
MDSITYRRPTDTFPSGVTSRRYRVPVYFAVESTGEGTDGIRRACTAHNDSYIFVPRYI